MAPKKFIRQETSRHFRIGKRRKKLQTWRRPKGRHSKMRKKRKSYPVSPSVGYKSPKKLAGRIFGLKPILISNLNELGRLNKDSAVIVARKVGARKKIEIIRKANEMNLKILNVKPGVKPHESK